MLLLFLMLVPTLAGSRPGATPDQFPVQGEEDSTAAEEAAKTLVPEAGVLPADTSPEAAALWRDLCASTRAPGQDLGPITAFDLSFDERVRSGAQRNEFAALVRYLAPDHLRFRLESGREQMRGPSGDWLVDGEEAVPLRGREHAEDRRQMDDWLAVAANFVSLSDPGSLRISGLALAEGTPTDLPAHLRATAKGLLWLTVDSPDFRLFLADGEAAGQSVFHAHLGLDPQDRSLSLALLLDIRPDEDRSQGAGTIRARVRSLLIQVFDHRPLDGYIIPRLLHLYQHTGSSGGETSAGGGQSRFEAHPSMELYVVDGSLAPNLTPADFEPR